MRRMVSAEDDTPILGAPIRVLVHLDSPILWIDMYMPSADAIASAVAESPVIKQSGLWIRRDHTLYIQCIDMTHYADRGKDRVLIDMAMNSNSEFGTSHFLSII
jgi:hypothetical protein